tara:strand:+ start:630 stop:2828 length:2199 start_codon:yes stop_codon:yes gene_type:complete
MIKKLIKIISVILILLITAVFYLSFFGVKTNKLNDQIINNILKINKNINLNLSNVSYLLNPFDFTVSIKAKNPQILFKNKNLGIKEVQTNIALKSIISDEYLINDLKIKTKEIKINDLITLVRTFQNSPQLLILDTIIKDGLVTGNINLNFDNEGNVKENYKIKGSVKKAKLEILNKVKLQNLNFNFDINKSLYLLEQIDMRLNNIDITSSLTEINKKKSSFFVNSEFQNVKQKFDIKELKLIFGNLFDNIDFRKIEFSSKNNFSFNINKNLKLNDLKVKSIINLNELIFNGEYIKLKPYLPNFVEEIKFEKHKIAINYSKNKFNIKGNGKISLENNQDNLSYQIIKNKKNYSFDSKINLKNNSLIIDFLDYKKKANLDSSILIKGSIDENKKLKFNLISLKEKQNEILIKDLDLSKNFKIIDVESFNIDYENNNKILNKINLKKNNLNFIIEGESFDASKIIDNIMDNDDENSSIFKSLTSRINIKIKKTYIDKVNYINNLFGNIDYNDNKIDNLKLEATFANKKKINFSIKTKNKSETITKLFTTYPKPLIKRYDFIKGFEEGNLDFYSTNKRGISNSVLVIDNFKVKEVPIFAKLLSLASLQGIADLLTGEGIRFTNFEMNFSNKKNLTTIDELYAIGPAVSILMDGYIESKKLVSLRGTLVPATTINRTIASIPLLGKILIGDKTGEGVFGVSFKIKGSPKNLKTSVNPIKTLTPRFITRTLEKIKNN